MPMMIEPQYKPNPFTTVAEAMELADYVITITDNFNKFPDYTGKERKNEDGTATVIFVERQDSLVNWVRQQTREIFVLAYTANQIDLRKEPWRKDERLGKQAQAVKLCEEHLAAIQLCRKHFHLTAKRIKFWGEKARKVKKSLEGWHEKDKDRYKNI